MNEDGSCTPKIKLSENSEKITNPGNKKIIRVYDSEGKVKADLICLIEEEFDPKDDLTLFDPQEPWKRTHLKGGEYSMRELMIQVFDKGECVYTSPSVMEMRDYCAKELDTLWDETRRLVNPHNVYVDLSQKLYDMKLNLLDEMSMN